MSLIGPEDAALHLQRWSFRMPDIHRTVVSNVLPIGLDRLTAAKMLGISIASLDRHVRAGRIPHRKLGRRVLFDRQTIESWLRSGPDV
jgi:excisionase family DNA binding protein